MKYILLSSTMLIETACFAQETTINYKNIFATAYTYVGIPKKDSLYVYGLSKDEWKTIKSFKIPKGTKAFDGNLRSVLFLLEDKIIIKEYYNCAEYCQSDTVVLKDAYKKISNKNWIRGINTTEAEFGLLDKEKELTIYKDDEEWKVSDQLNPNLYKENKTNPELRDNMKFDKLYNFGETQYLVTVNNREVRFYPYVFTIDKLNEGMVNYKILNIDLPKDVITAFIYDFTQMGWVYKDRIEFYKFDASQQAWVKDASIKTLFY
ncbi:hypothetical protein SAMN05216436_106171 [bacterium A37T11]|nr:hypothetical protein SAMN05216436_106171 [bacterium A37T11]